MARLLYESKDDIEKGPKTRLHLNFTALRLVKQIKIRSADTLVCLSELARTFVAPPSRQ